MKKILKTTLAILLAAGAFTSCSLDEWNPSTVDADMAYNNRESWESLVNYCYDGIYYLYGKSDGIGAMEMGTDLWTSESAEAAFTRYQGLNSSTGTLYKFWNALYATVNYCNTALHYVNTVDGYTDNAEREAKAAEAYFLRGWANWHIVEQYGNCVLNEKALVGNVPDVNPVRSSEADFYNLIIEDLKYAVDKLPISQAERGRATKKAALGMLAKVYLQRTRLNEPEAKEYARLALETAEELIENADAYGCGLYESAADKSGFAELFNGKNNKANKEFLFVEAVDHSTSYNNPDGSNRGRTRQYYAMNSGNFTKWGLTKGGCYWLTQGSAWFKPTKYLLTELFEPVKDPADTRFAVSFFTEYYNMGWPPATTKIDQALIDEFHKDQSLLGHEILGTGGAYNAGQEYWNGTPTTLFYGSAVANMVDEDNDGWFDGLSVYTPNYVIPADEKAKLPFLCVDPSDMFHADGTWVTSADPLGTYFKEAWPSLKKFSAIEYCMNNKERWLGDMEILRLGDIYLVAAEAALLYNNDQATALKYVQPIRNRAAVAGRQSEMAVTTADMTLDFILAERGRELAGEQWRWYDLKRMGKLNTVYLMQTNPDITGFDEAKHQVRPIPQSFLDAIANAAAFGNNGY